MNKSHIKTYALYIAWLAAVFSLAGSLYFSEVLHFQPCILCWYQRICMYPLALILTIGILKEDKNVDLYALPFSIIGLGIAFYHFLLQRGIISEQLAPCQYGVSCTTLYGNWFGFITIPLLSLISFTIITISILIFRKYKHT